MNIPELKKFWMVGQHCDPRQEYIFFAERKLYYIRTFATSNINAYLLNEGFQIFGAEEEALRWKLKNYQDKYVEQLDKYSELSQEHGQLKRKYDSLMKELSQVKAYVE